jgi:eukaryotic-like serine/threonine-protein kinase
LATSYRIGRYDIVGHLATGGMAEVLLGKLLGPSGFERTVVIKRILPHLAREQRFVEMFLAEARTVALIRHANVVQVHELGQDGDDLFLVMEYLDGETASSLIRRLRFLNEPLPTALAAHIVAEACAGLHSAHELTNEDGVAQHVVHRDVSPQNVMVLYDGQVKVLDFGIAKAADTNIKTEAGQIKGKWAYMSPEQCLGEPLDRRSDVFSLGILLFELTTERRLFARDGELRTMRAICDEPVVRPSSVMASYPKELEHICLRALSRHARDRYSSALELRRDLLEVSRRLWPDPTPEATLATMMWRSFGDRIQEKREMLRRIRSGSELTSVPNAEADEAVDIPVAVDDASVVGPVAVPISGDGTPYAPRKRTGLVLGIAAAVVVLALGATAGAIFLGGSSPRAEDAPPRESRSATPPPARAPIEPSAMQEDEEEEEEEEEERAREVTIHVTSDPDGATVTVAGEAHGITPADVSIARGSEAVELVIARDGYQERVEHVVPDVDQRISIELRRVRRERGTGMSAEVETPEPPAATEMAGFHRFD